MILVCDRGKTSCAVPETRLSLGPSDFIFVVSSQRGGIYRRRGDAADIPFAKFALLDGLRAPKYP